jgi:hypothetical protein
MRLFYQYELAKDCWRSGWQRDILDDNYGLDRGLIRSYLQAEVHGLEAREQHSEEEKQALEEIRREIDELSPRSDEPAPGNIPASPQGVLGGQRTAPAGRGRFGSIRSGWWPVGLRQAGMFGDLSHEWFASDEVTRKCRDYASGEAEA